MRFLLIFLFPSICLASTNYSKVLDKINTLTRTTDFLEQFNLGENDQGQMIKGVRYIGGSNKKTNHLIVATHHGNEVLSTDLAIKFLEFLKQKGAQYFSNKNLYIVPVLNIGGYNKENREELDYKGRSHDPNRDYPDPCVKKQNFKLKSTQALATLVRSEDIVGAVTIHGYYGSLTYPWGIYTDNFETLDHKTFHNKAKDAVVSNSYEIGTHADILYPAGGAFEDWAYYEKGIWSYLIELENRPNWGDDIQMLAKTISSFPDKRSSSHEHTGRCTQTKDYGISRP